MLLHAQKSHNDSYSMHAQTHTKKTAVVQTKSLIQRINADTAFIIRTMQIIAIVESIKLMK